MVDLKGYLLFGDRYSAQRVCNVRIKDRMVEEVDGWTDIITWPQELHLTLLSHQAAFLPEATIFTAHNTAAVSISSVRKKCIERKYPGLSPVPQLVNFRYLPSIL